MASDRWTSRRWWLLASILVVLLTLALAGSGIALALQQGRVVQQARVQGLRDRAEIVANRLQADLRRLATRRLRQIHEAYLNRDETAFQDLVLMSEGIELAFVYDRWALITWPPTTVARSDRSYEAFAPPGFGVAEQLEFVDRKLDQAIEIYKLCTSEATPVYWQLRAQMAIAACRTKQNRPDLAVAIYRRLLDEYAMVLRGLEWPSLFSVHLALIDVLRSSERLEQAAEAAEQLVDQVLAGHVPLPAREYADLLLRRLTALTDRGPNGIAELGRQLEEIASRQHRLAGAASVVRAWMEPRLDLPLGTEERGVQFVTETLGVRPRALAYQRSSEDGSEMIVGLCIHLPTFYQAFVRPTVREASGGDLVAEPVDDQPGATGTTWYQPLAAPLQRWQLQAAPGFVERIARESRRQTYTYVALSATAVIVLLAAMIALIRLVRREIALTQLKNEFVANVSHELKTPLALIRLFGETLLYGRTVGDDKRSEYYAVITRESERLTHLINNILDFSSIDAGQKRYQRSLCDVGDVVQQTLDAYRFQLDHQGFACEFEIAQDLPLVLADPDAIRQAVLNLLNNAVKYSPDEKRVEVRVDPASRNGRSGVAIAITDRGMGIAPEDQKHLFEGFYRGSDRTVQTIRGSGLGLTLVHHIVSGHEGEVSVQSAPGSGSTFTLFLPRADAKEDEDTSCHAS